MRQSCQAIAQLGQIAWAGRPQCDSRQNAFEIPDSGQRFADVCYQAIGEFANGGIALAQYIVIAQRPAYPPSQKTASHRGVATIHDARQCMPIVTAQADSEFEVASRGGIHDECLIALFDVQASNVRDGGTLRIGDVLQQATRGADGRTQILRTKPAQVTCTELATK